MSNKLTMTAMEILSIEADLPLRFEYKDRPYPTVDDFEMYILSKCGAARRWDLEV